MGPTLCRDHEHIHASWAVWKDIVELADEYPRAPVNLLARALQAARSLARVSVTRTHRVLYFMRGAECRAQEQHCPVGLCARWAVVRLHCTFFYFLPMA